MSVSPADLPAFIPPMLASASAPFDDDDWLFEIKWDGFRSLCRVDGDGLRLLGRRKTDFTRQFPQLDCLARLPAGLIIDGEIVAIRSGKPDFTALLGLTGVKRVQPHPTSPSPRMPTARNSADIIYVAFDLLYHDYRPVMELPCDQRRQMLNELIQAARASAASHERTNPLRARLMFSSAIAGSGTECFEHATRMGLEGIIAKRRGSPYKPGARSADWLKIKRRHQMVCAIVGYEPSPERGLRSLIIAGVVDGKMQCVGRVGSGIGEAAHGRLLKQLQSIRRATPAVPSDINGQWVDPILFCRVQYDQQLPSGSLRSPVFEGLISNRRNQAMKSPLSDDSDASEKGPEQSMKQ